MPSKTAVIVIISLLTLKALSANLEANYPIEDEQTINIKIFGEDQANQRFLQATFSNDNVVKESLDRVVAKANSIRNAQGVSEINVNINLQTKISQWASNLRDSMSLTQYFQLFAINNINIEIYESVPSENIADVVAELSNGLYDPIYTELARYYNALDGRNYQLIFVFQGGFDGQKVVFTKEQIQKIVMKNNENTNKTTNYTKFSPAFVPSKPIQAIKPVIILPPVQVKQDVTSPLQAQNQPEMPIIGAPTTNTKANITQTAPIIIPILLTQPKKVTVQTRPTPPFIFPILPSSSSLSLVTQTNFSNTTSYQNIILTHGIPRTFLKGQYFPFRGFITEPNPAGITVSVIFTRTSDQKRLSFTQSLPAGTTEFSILANLNASGKYYLSIFAGVSSSTSSTIFTINSGFIGHIVSKPPTSIKSVTSQVIGNDLLLNWTSSDVSQPALTQIILSQISERSITFLISNYESSFLVPYSELTTFKEGIINIQISQAFSNNESANLRTSAFSAPFNLIFNTPRDQLATLTLAEINNIQSQVVAFLLEKFNLNGQFKPLSASVRTYQSMANPIDFDVYMTGLGFDSAVATHVSVEYNDGKFLQELKASNVLAPSSPQKQVGVSVKYSKGNLDLFIVYA